MEPIEERKTISDSYEVQRHVRASPKRLFEAWLDRHEHTEITGGTARISAVQGEAFSTLDGLNTGENLEIEPYHRIVQSWRTAESGADVFESRVEVVLATGAESGGLPGSAHDAGTTVKVHHSDLPPGQTLFTDRWWEDHYFKPMDTYFAQGNLRFTRPPQPPASLR